MASNENGKYMKNIGDRLPISGYFNNPEYSQFREYCADSNIFFIDELQPYDYVAFRSQYKVDNEFARVIRSKVEALKSNLSNPVSSTASPVSILCDQEFESLSFHDEKSKPSWEQMVQVTADAHMNTPLDDLEIPARIRHRLMSIGVTTIGKMLLMKSEELRSIGFLGTHSIDHILAVSENLVNQYNNQLGHNPGFSSNPNKVDEPTQNTTEEAATSIEKQSDNHQFVENSINKDIIALIAQAVTQDHMDLTLDTLQLSARAHHRLESAGINTIVKVLLASDDQLLSIKHLGNSLLQEIRDAKNRFLQDYIAQNPYWQEKLNGLHLEIEQHNQSIGTNANLRLSNHLRLYIEDILLGNLQQENEFSFTLPESQIIKKVTESIEVLGLDLFTQFYKDPEQTQSLIQALQAFNHQLKVQNDFLELFVAIPVSRREKKLRPFIKLFCHICGTAEEDLSQALITCVTINHIQDQIYSIFDKRIIIILKRFLEWLSSDISKITDPILAEINEKDRVKEILARRARGDTLESISEVLGVTRERIRQIEAKVFRNIKTQKCFRNLLSAVSAELDGETTITYADFQKVTTESEILWYLLRKEPSDEYVFDKNIDCFYLTSEFDPDSIYDLVSNLPKWIKESEREILLSDIEKKNNVPVKYLNLLFGHFYQQTGTIWHQGKMNRGSMYSFIVKHYFPNGIQIYDANEMARFKKYLREEFGDINCSENDRAFCGIIQRTCILYDRGVYIHPSKVAISDELVNRIEIYFVESGRTSMAYHELFDKFADELLTQANISNRYVLQGVLRDRWGEKYEFYRDGISTKEGHKITQEIESYIRNYSPVSKDMLRSTFSGITEAMLMQNIARIPSVILGDTATFIHSDQLNLTDNDYSIRNVIKTLTEDSPVTASKLLEALYHSHSDFLFRNDISTPNLLFGVLQYMFSDEFSFSRPYISSLNIENISKREVILSLLDGQESIDIADLVALCEENHVSYQSTTLLISSMDDAFLRVDENTLISITCIPITDEKLDQIKSLLTDAIGAKGYLIIKAIDNYIFYPDLVYPWTPYLLCSIIDKYLADNFRLINNPTNRNISSDFIVDTRVGIDSYEDLVRSAIRTEHQREPFKDLANVVLWLVNEGFFAEKAIILKEDQDLFNSTTIRLVNRNIPKFILDRSFIYIDEYKKLCIL